MLMGRLIKMHCFRDSGSLKDSLSRSSAFASKFEIDPPPLGMNPDPASRIQNRIHCDE